MQQEIVPRCRKAPPRVCRRYGETKPVTLPARPMRFVWLRARNDSSSTGTRSQPAFDNDSTVRSPQTPQALVTVRFRSSSRDGTTTRSSKTRTNYVLRRIGARAVTHADEIVDACDDALGIQKARHQVSVVPRRAHRHRQRSLCPARVRLTVLEKDLEWLLHGDQVAGVFPAPALDALDLRGSNRSAGHRPRSLQRINPSKKGSDPFF